MLTLSEKDLLALAEPNEILDAIDGVMELYESGDFMMPLRSHLEQGENTYLLMPCFTSDYIGTKLVSVFPGNAEKGLPVLGGVMVLHNAETGQPVAIINGRVLTALRTGAVGAVGVRHLSHEHTTDIGLIGAGVQGFNQIWFAANARPVQRVHIYDAYPDGIPVFMEKLSEKLPDVEMIQHQSASDLVAASQTVMCATTSMEPVLPDDADLLKGRHFVSVGSFRPAMREFPQSLYGLIDRLLVDTYHAKKEVGDVIDPLEKGWLQEEQVKTLGGFLGEKPDMEKTRNTTTAYKSVGMALFDVCVAGMFYEKAKAWGMGLDIDL